MFSQSPVQVVYKTYHWHTSEKSLLKQLNSKLHCKFTVNIVISYVSRTPHKEQLF